MNPSEELLKERQAIYGPPEENHENVGLMWAGLIQQHYGITLPHPLPCWLVELMLVQLKASRAARVYHSDNYIDMIAYARFAADHQGRDKSAKPAGA